MGKLGELAGGIGLGRGDLEEPRGTADQGKVTPPGWRGWGAMNLAGGVHPETENLVWCEVTRREPEGEVPHQPTIAIASAESMEPKRDGHRGEHAIDDRAPGQLALAKDHQPPRMLVDRRQEQPHTALRAQIGKGGPGRPAERPQRLTEPAAGKAQPVPATPEGEGEGVAHHTGPRVGDAAKRGGGHQTLEVVAGGPRRDQGAGDGSGAGGRDVLELAETHGEPCLELLEETEIGETFDAAPFEGERTEIGEGVAMAVVHGGGSEMALASPGCAVVDRGSSRTVVVVMSVWSRLVWSRSVWSRPVSGRAGPCQA